MRVTAESKDKLAYAGTLFKLHTVFQRNLVNQYVRNITNVLARLASYSMISIIVGMIFWHNRENLSRKYISLSVKQIWESSVQVFSS